MLQRVTMADVAREAGVSVMTVSRVVNRKDGISEATRQRVQAIIDQMDYRPSDIARGLVTARTGTIGLVVLDNANPFFSEMARGVEHVAYAEGYNVFLCNTEEDIQRELTVLHSLEEKRVDGLVLCSSRLDDDTLTGVLARYPAVVLVNRQIDARRYVSVMQDDHHCATLAVKHLIASGRRRIGMITGPDKSFTGQRRVASYHQTLDDAGLPHPLDWTHASMPTLESGQEAAALLLNEHPELDALYCYNDLNAIGALHTCADLGRRVPEDIAIVGSDDIMLAGLVTPSLTTCRTPMYDMGSEAMRLLLSIINGCQACDDIIFEPELIVRASAP